MSKLDHSPKNCEAVAWAVVDCLELEDLQQIAFDDIYAVMIDSQELFELNVENVGQDELEKHYLDQESP